MKKLLMLVAAIIIGITGIVFAYEPCDFQSCIIKFVELGYEETCRLYPDCCQFIPPVEGEYGLIEID